METATESFSYWLDGKARDHTDARGNVTTTMWSHCCGFHRATAEPAADVDNDPTTADTRAVRVDYRDSENRVAHTYTAPDWSPYPQDPASPESVYSNPPTTLNETTIRYDSLGRPIAQTVWMIEIGSVSKNDPPIAGDHGTNVTDGLTTRWVYDDDLTDGNGLDVTYAAYLTGLNLGTNSVGSAVEITNPNGEKTLTIHDGAGRTIRTVDALGHTNTLVYDTVVGGLLETAAIDALNHTQNLARTARGARGRVKISCRKSPRFSMIIMATEFLGAMPTLSDRTACLMLATETSNAPTLIAT